MKKHNATISVKSEIVSGDDSDSIELLCDGDYYLQNGNFYILYDEKAEMGMAECSVRVKISDEQVTVSRIGEFSSKMIYKSGEQTEFIYYTPYSSFPIVIKTNDVECAFNEYGGKLTLNYSLDIQGEVSKHITSISAKINNRDSEENCNEN